MATKKSNERGSGLVGMLPLIAGVGLVGLGGYVWYRSQKGGDDGGSGGGDDPLVVAMKDKIDAMTLYHTQIYGEDGTRQPTASELQTLGMMAEAMQSEEDHWEWVDRTRYREAMAHYYQDIGLFVILPLVTGFISVGGMIVYDRYRRGGGKRPPTSCPGCGVSLPNEDAAVAHVVNIHTVNPDAVSEAAETWTQQPYWVVTATGAIGGAYSAAYDPISSWDFDSLSKNVQGMMYAFAMGIGTSGTLVALQQTLVYCLI